MDKNEKLIDEENKEQTEEKVVISTEKSLIDKDNAEDIINNNILDSNNKCSVSDNKSANKSAHLTKIKKVLIKNDLIENDINKNNLSSIENNKKNVEINNSIGQNKIINLIKIRNINLDKAYDKTKSGNLTTNNPNVYKAKPNNINKEEIIKDE